ncbi:MAG: haloacid dehalogenase-like hydrolase [bacterium]
MPDTSNDQIPLFVDLDGTVIKEDAMWISLRLIARTKPWLLAVLSFYVLGGRAAFKSGLARFLTPDPALLPYNDDVLKFLRDEKDRGRRLILATAANRRVAESVFRYLGLFHDVMASDSHRNLKGPTKLAAILGYTKGRPFDYMGDSMADLPILEAAATGYLVHPRRQLAELAQKTCRIGRVFS